MHVRKIAWRRCLSQPVNWPKLSCRLLSPWCTAITGYHARSVNSNSQQQTTTGYRQTSKSLPDASQPRRVKITTNRIYMWRFKYANTMPTVLCVHEQWFNRLSGLICGYITSIHDKRIVTSCEIYHNPSKFYNCYVLYYSPIILR